MKNIISKLLSLSVLSVSLMLTTTCIKLEKSMLVSTGEVTNISARSADAAGEIIDLGEGAVQHGHYYGKSPNLTTSDLKTQLGQPSAIGGFTSQLSDLETSTKYYIKAYINDGTETVFGIEKSFTTGAASAPVVTTTSISDITSTSASSGGNITSDGGSPVTARGVCWNNSAGPTLNDIVSDDGTGSGSFTSSLTSLSPNTTYYVRAYATNSIGTDYGDEISFKTDAAASTPPTAAAASATALTNTTATLNGAVNANGSNTIVTFEYGTTILYGSAATATQSPVTGTSATEVDATLTGLTSGTLYHFRVKAVSSEGTTFSDDLTFTTLQLPVSTTGAATSVTNTTATLNGTVNAANLSTTVTFEYGTSISYGSTVAAIPDPVTGGNPTSVSADLTDLIPQTTYHFRVKAESAGGTTYGNDQTFQTLCTAPTLTTDVATNPDSTTITLNGTVNANSFSTTVTFEYGTTTAYGSSIGATPGTVSDNSYAAISAGVTGLLSNTLYHYRIKAVNCAGTVYGSDQTFTTLCTTPNTLTLDASSITSATATLNGMVNPNNCNTTVTFEYGPTISYGSTISAAQSPLSGTGSIAVSADINGLSVGTVYHYRVKAVSPGGTNYGNDISFTTNAVAPTLITTPIESITSSTASSGGDITFDGGAPVTAHGVCWSTSTNPTIADSKTADGSGSGLFTSSIEGLTLGVTYYVRAYATNTAGTAYGNEISLTTALAIGQDYQGGKLAYILKSGDPGYVSGETHGIIAAPYDQETSISWCLSSDYLNCVGNTYTGIGAGPLNTQRIVNQGGAGYYAAKLCYDLELNGYSDWYLPSRDELTKLRLNKIAIGGFADSRYWSSSEGDEFWGVCSTAYSLHMLSGSSTDSKQETYRVRAIRSF